MTEFVRTADAHFDALEDFQFPPHYHAWQDLRMHYLDEGPRDGPVALLMHGMPTWSYLYRDVIPVLVDAGYRCIAPDHMGFGRSDKPTDIHWYTIARHTEILTSLIVTLDLQRILLVAQDWGGPTGLAQAATMPDRFDHLVIANTWLHHAEYEYSPAIHNWNQNWHDGGMFDVPQPDFGLLMLMASGLWAPPAPPLPSIGAHTHADGLEGVAARMYAGFSAPFRDLPDAGFNGARRFPLSIPLDNVHNGNAAAQAHHYRTLLEWKKGVHFVWGCRDAVFTEAWGRTWAERMNARFDGIEDAGHFPQNTHGARLAELILQGVD